MIEKRFKLVCNNIEYINQYELLLPIKDGGENLSLGCALDLLNELSEENRQLEKENKQLKEKLDKEFPILDYRYGRHLYCREMTDEEIEKWNEILKKAMMCK